MSISGAYSAAIGCCICSETIEDTDGCVTLIIRVDEREQVWFAHRTCFEESLHPVYRIFSWSKDVV